MAPKVDAPRVVWTVVIAGFLALAVAAPLEIVRFRSEVSEARKAASVTAETERIDGGRQARVSMAALTFTPEVLAVRRGTEVVFENNDVTPHTVTDAAGAAFDSGTLNSRTVFKLVVQDTIEYLCLIHPTMRGKIILTG